MATVIELSRQGKLFKLDPALDGGEQEYRVLYASPRLRSWIEGTLPGLGSTWKIEQSPVEQLDALLQVYASGEPLVFGHSLKPLTHLGDGVWELKTADIRIFGWFSARDWFIGDAADTAERIKHHKLYRGYANQVVRFRAGLDLCEPKFVAGDDPNDVVSNFAYP